MGQRGSGGYLIYMRAAGSSSPNSGCVDRCEPSCPDAYGLVHSGVSFTTWRLQHLVSLPVHTECLALFSIRASSPLSVVRLAELNCCLVQRYRPSLAHELQGHAVFIKVDLRGYCSDTAVLSELSSARMLEQDHYHDCSALKTDTKYSLLCYRTCGMLGSVGTVLYCTQS